MMEKSRKQWLEERRKAIGASESPAILGISPYSSALAVWADKLGLVQDDAESEPMRWGTILEPIILKEYARQKGLEIEHCDQTKVLRHPEWPNVPMSCTPDGRVRDDGCYIQVKCVGAHMKDRWAEGPPIDVVVQVQHEMAVTGSDEELVVVLFGGNEMADAVVERNDAFINELETNMALWWQTYVESEIEPAADATDSSIRILQKLHPDDSGIKISLDNDYYLNLDNQLLEVKAQLKELSQKKKNIENIIKAALGDATFGKLSNGVTYSWKTIERAGYVVEPSKFRQLRRTKK